MIFLLLIVNLMQRANLLLCAIIILLRNLLSPRYQANSMINNNNIDYYPSYEKDNCLGALSNNKGCLVVCNMKLTDTKRNNCLGSSCNNVDIDVSLLIQVNNSICDLCICYSILNLNKIKDPFCEMKEKFDLLIITLFM